MRTRIFTLLVAFLAIAGNAVWGQDHTFPGGDGSEGNPYQISTPEDLKAFRALVNGGDADACAILTDDIDLENEEWEPIGYYKSNPDYSDEISYTGTFDGNHKTISGLCIGKDVHYWGGLFEVIGTYGMGAGLNFEYEKGGCVKDLTVKGSVSMGFDKHSGGIAGGNIGLIQGCISCITKEGEEETTFGGICCSNYNTIRECINKGSINASGYSGGICAINSGLIEECYNEGDISGTNIGGICGNVDAKGEIKNCYNIGTIKAEKKAAGICCVPDPLDSDGETILIANCHNYGTITGKNSAGICIVTDDESVNITAKNNYYLENTANAGFIYINNVQEGTVNDQLGQTESKTEAEFADGTVLYLLQSGNPGDDKVWEQTIGTDEYPVFDASSTPSVVYQVTVQPNDAAMGTTAGGGIFQAGTEITVTATPNEGYEFINWTIGEEEQSTETTYTFEVTASVTLIANFQKIDEGGEDEPGDDDQDNDKPGTIVKPIKYYNIYIDTICPGLDVEVSKDVVQEGHQVSAYLTIQAECDTTGMRFEYKRGLFGYWKDLKELEGVQPGEYIIKNIYTDIYIRALDATLPEEEPTGIDDLEGIKAYAKDGSIYVYTPNREEVTIISMSGAIIKHAEQVGLQSYSVNRGIYIVRIGDKVFKLKN